MTWKQRIKNAKKNNGVFSDKSVDNACNWSSCALGEKLDLTKDNAGAVASWTYEKHNELYRLGQRFTNAVANNDDVEAQECYEEIQAYDLDRNQIPPNVLNE